MVVCSVQTAYFWAYPGETYTILAVDAQFEDGGGSNGGRLDIALDVPLPHPTIDVTVDPIGHFDATTGSATVGGTVTCAGKPESAVIRTELRQAVGRVSTVVGVSTIFDIRCDGETYRWSAEVTPGRQSDQHDVGECVPHVGMR